MNQNQQAARLQFTANKDGLSVADFAKLRYERQKKKRDEYKFKSEFIRVFDKELIDD